MKKVKLNRLALAPEEIASVVYHDVFNYPLTQNDLIRWKAGFYLKDDPPSIKEARGFYFVLGKNGLVYQRLKNERYSAKKSKLIQKSLPLLRLIPSINLVAIIGSLAMKNSKAGDDLDLLIVTKPNSLWLTRLITYVLLFFFGIRVRRNGQANEKDKLCLNMWMEESSLVWAQNDRNSYTAHEIAQITPLINRRHTLERLISQNSWIKSYWPNAIRITKFRLFKIKKTPFVIKFLNNLAFRFQYWYMKKKISHEQVRKNRALFHPHVRSGEVQQKLEKYGFSLLSQQTSSK